LCNYIVICIVEYVESDIYDINARAHTHTHAHSRTHARTHL